MKRTGKSKMDFQNLFISLLNPLKLYYSSGCALLSVGHTGTVYSDHVAKMESFARPLWGLAPYLAGGGCNAEFTTIYQNGLQSGTDPAHPEYWGGFHDYDQRFVEMAAIAFGLLMAPEQFWTPLPDEAKQNLAAWLNGINKHECVPNNWQFFCVLVNTALAACSMPYDEQRLADSLERLETWYAGNGWYRDGENGQTDYYIGFAIQFYSLIYARFMEKSDPVRSSLYKRRAAEFAKDFIYWFDDAGLAVPYGRSLTYRFAQISFFGACVWAGVDAFPLPVMKGIIVRHLTCWMDAPITDSSGILTPGYGYPNLHMCEEYNGPGSSYWSMKAFIFLALEDAHPFWSADEAPLPGLESLHVCKGSPMITQRIRGQAVLYPPGNTGGYRHQHMEAKYSKFAYSSQMGFHVSISHASIEEAAPDSTLSFELNGIIFVRDIIKEYSSDRDSHITTWSPFAGITVTTTITPAGEGHIRHHQIESNWECSAYDSGFSVPRTDEHFIAEEYSSGQATISNHKWTSRVYTEQQSGEGIIIKAMPNTNIVAPRASIPSIKYPIKKGTTIFKTFVTLQPADLIKRTSQHCIQWKHARKNNVENPV